MRNQSSNGRDKLSFLVELPFSNRCSIVGARRLHRVPISEHQAKQQRIRGGHVASSSARHCKSVQCTNDIDCEGHIADFRYSTPTLPQEPL